MSEWKKPSGNNAKSRKGTIARKVTLSVAALASIFLTGSCTTNKKQPTLVIVGGYFQQSNAPLYRHILDKGGSEAVMSIYPTASGVPEESGPLTKKDFDQYVTDETVQVFDLRMGEFEKAEDPATIANIESSDIIFFTGGDQSRILNVFRPEPGHSSLAWQALNTHLDNKGVIAGTSAGAAMMSDPMIKWGVSEEALLVGEHDVPDRAVGLTRGMGFFPYGLTDQHFLYRARFGRLIAAQEARDIPFGFGVEENSAISVNLKNNIISPVGPQALFFVDIREAKKDGLNRENIRISVLGDGDTVDGVTGNVTLAKNKSILSKGIRDANEWDLPEDVWANGEFQEFLPDWLVSGDREARIDTEHFELVFTKDARTLVRSTWEDPYGDISASNLRLDIIAKEGATEAAAALLEELNK